MPKKHKEPSDRVTIRLTKTLRGDLQLLAKADKREDESDYWRKVLREHVEDARKSGKLPLETQQELASVGGVR